MADANNNRKIRPVRMWVVPSFKNLINIEAAKSGKTIIEFTKELSQKDDQIQNIINDWDKKLKRIPDKRFDFP